MLIINITSSTLKVVLLKVVIIDQLPLRLHDKYLFCIRASFGPICFLVKTGSQKTTRSNVSATMKTKAIQEGIRENYPHCVCQKSTLILKSSYFSRRISQITEVDTSSHPDVHPTTGVSIEDIRCDEVVGDEYFSDAIAEDGQSGKHNSDSVGPTIEEFNPANGQSKVETMCSPSLERAELHNLTNVLIEAVSRDDPDMPQLLAEDSDDSARVSCDYQTCTVSDFAVCDMISAGSGLSSEINWRDFYTDYQCAESNRLLDVSEHYMLPSFLEDMVEKSKIKDAESSGETVTDLDSSGLNLAVENSWGYHSDANLDSCSHEFGHYDPADTMRYLSDASSFFSHLWPEALNFPPPLSVDEICKRSNIQDAISSKEASMVSDASGLIFANEELKSRDQDFEVKLNLCSDQAECLDPEDVIKYLSDAPNCWTPLSPNKKCTNKSVTLVLDLDETLIHSSVDRCTDADFTFPLCFKMKELVVYVKQRPFLHTFLKRVAEMFHVVVFTASESIYAKPLLDILDPEGKHISQRVYRESCIFSDGNCTKDLTVLGVELSKVAIIDNTPQVFHLQANNGIPIKSWFDDPSDRALLSLLPFLETLAEADDVRPIIANRYSNK